MLALMGGRALFSSTGDKTNPRRGERGAGGVWTLYFPQRGRQTAQGKKRKKENGVILNSRVPGGTPNCPEDGRSTQSKRGIQRRGYKSKGRGGGSVKSINENSPIPGGGKLFFCKKSKLQGAWGKRQETNTEKMLREKKKRKGEWL